MTSKCKREKMKRLRREKQQREWELRLERERELLLGIIHDIRSPLTAVMYQIGFLLLSTGDPKNEHRLKMAKRNSEKIQRMIEDCMDSIALMEGKMKLDMSYLSLRPFLVEIISDMVPEERERIRYESMDYTSDEDLLGIIGDRLQLERAILNLLTNSLKYSDQQVRIEIRKLEKEAVLSIKDEGQGISSEDLPHIFERLYRGAKSPHKKGIGLGLFIAKLIVEAHGGRIWAESYVGRGSTFYIALPCA